MNAAEPLTGAEWLARTLAANGTTHVFFIDAVLRRTLISTVASPRVRVRRMRRVPQSPLRMAIFRRE